MKFYSAKHRLAQRAWTIIELVAVIFIIFVTTETGKFVAKNYGIWAGIGAGILSATMCVIALVLFYRANGRRFDERRRELREKYCRIYRVLAVPSDGAAIKKAQGAEIKVGDFGWEAAPL